MHRADQQLGYRQLHFRRKSRVNSTFCHPPKFNITTLIIIMVAPIASSSRSATAPSADSLAFSANLFTSQIDSWIPANFGMTYQPPSDLINNADQDGNLGIGHPSLEVPKYKRQDHGTGQLEKMLGLNKKGKGRAEDTVSTIKKDEQEDEDEQEESRGSIGKKRKFGTVDLLAGKKKGKAKMKAQMMDVRPITTKPISTPTQSEASQDLASSISVLKADRNETDTPTTSQATPTPNHTQSTQSTVSPNTTLTKNQRKNLRKKQKKAAAEQGPQE